MMFSHEKCMIAFALVKLGNLPTDRSCRRLSHLRHLCQQVYHVMFVFEKNMIKCSFIRFLCVRNRINCSV